MTIEALAATEGVAVVHSLKCWPDFFEPLLSGEKNFEIRRDDRGFDVGHILSLWEWCPERMCYTGRSIVRRVTHVHAHDAGVPGLESGYCILALQPLRASRPTPFDDTLTGGAA